MGATRTRQLAVIVVTALTVVGGVGGLGLDGSSDGVSPVGVASAAPVTGCTTISTPGTYRLQNDISNSGADTCIHINASDVAFFGQGYTIDGIDDIGSTGIRVEAGSTLSNVTVRNVRLTDWDSAIYYRDVFTGIIGDTTATDNIQAGTLGAVNVFEGEGITVTDNNASGNQGFGIIVHGQENEIEENLATDNAGGINNGTGGGIQVAGTHSRVEQNIVRRNERVGLELELLFESEVRRNIATDNGDLGPGFPRYGYNGGIVVLTAENNTIVANNASGNEVGIRLRSSGRIGPVTNNHFEDNTAQNNAVWDFISTNHTVGNHHVNLFIGDSVVPTTITFNQSRDIALRSVSNPPPDPPTKQNIGHYVNGTNITADSFVFLNISYQDSDVTSAGVTESSLRMWRYLTAWQKVQGTNGVNTVENYVFANITSFPPPPEVFAPLGNESEATPTPTPTPTATPGETPTPGEPDVVYMAKFVCGRIPDGESGELAIEEPPAKPGNYATAINIGNLLDEEVEFTLRASVASTLRTAGGEPAPGPVSTAQVDVLGGKEALEYDCADIIRMFGRELAESRFVKGFLTIETTHELAVTAVYTSRTSRDPAAGKSIDVEDIDPHRLGGDTSDDTAADTDEEKDAGGPADTPAPTQRSLPGFGIPGVIVAFLLVGLLARLHRRRD